MQVPNTPLPVLKCLFSRLVIMHPFPIAPVDSQFLVSRSCHHLELPPVHEEMKVSYLRRVAIVNHLYNMVPKFSLTSLNGLRGEDGLPSASVVGLRCLARIVSTIAVNL